MVTQSEERLVGWGQWSMFRYSPPPPFFSIKQWTYINPKPTSLQRSFYFTRRTQNLTRLIMCESRRLLSPLCHILFLNVFINKGMKECGTFLQHCGGSPHLSCSCSPCQWQFCLQNPACVQSARSHCKVYHRVCKKAREKGLSVGGGLLSVWEAVFHLYFVCVCTAQEIYKNAREAQRRQLSTALSSDFQT